MADQTIAGALLLGLTEGLTEFIPVSSTGHILLLGHFIGFNSTGKTFEVLIQLGAVLAVLAAYANRLIDLARRLPQDGRVARFLAGIVIAFLPAALLGAGLHGFIKTILFHSPALICTALIVGGIILLLVDRLATARRYGDVIDFPLGLCAGIGLFQCLALVPGVSRSGATIAGALLLGTDKRSAAEFSFFLAMPTMLGAFAYDLYINHALLDTNDIAVIAAGFLMAFISALFVVRHLLDYVSRHGFALFAYWRILIGALGLVALT